MTASFSQRADLTGRTALVIGGAGHIGSAIAHGLADLGAAIAIADVDAQRADLVAGELRAAYGCESSGHVVDLEEEAATAGLPSSVVETFGGLDIVVHCAALVGTTPLEGWAVPFAQQSVQTWRRALEVNLTSAFVVTQAAEPFLARSGAGSVILVSSIYGLLGPDPSLYVGTDMGRPAAYFASKGGMHQLMRWMASEMAPDVRVNVVCPGGVARGQDASFVERYVAKTPLARMATEDDFVGPVAFLASDLSQYVTGQEIVVDGGITIR